MPPTRENLPLRWRAVRPPDAGLSSMAGPSSYFPLRFSCHFSRGNSPGIVSSLQSVLTLRRKSLAYLQQLLMRNLIPRYARWICGLRADELPRKTEEFLLATGFFRRELTAKSQSGGTG